MKPRVVVVYPSSDRGFEVVVSDLVMPGVVVATSKAREDANRICIALAMSQRVRALPLRVES